MDDLYSEIYELLCEAMSEGGDATAIEEIVRRCIDDSDWRDYGPLEQG